MDTLENVLLIIHIVTGTIALIAGSIAGFLKKQRGQHSKMGKVFTLSMYINGISGLALSFIINNVFLLVIAVFTLYMVITGSRAFKRNSKLFYLTVSIFGLLSAAGLLYIGIVSLIKSGNPMASVPLVFGILLLSMTRREWRTYRGNRPKNPKAVHANQMGGSLIAAYTAFLSTGANRLFILMDFNYGPYQIYFWLTPTVVGTILLIRANRNMAKA